MPRRFLWIRLGGKVVTRKNSAECPCSESLNSFLYDTLAGCIDIRALGIEGLSGCLSPMDRRLVQHEESSHVVDVGALHPAYPVLENGRRRPPILGRRNSHIYWKGSRYNMSSQPRTDWITKGRTVKKQQSKENKTKYDGYKIYGRTLKIRGWQHHLLQM